MTISLYIRVPINRRKKPISWRTLKVSHPSINEINQISIVLEVSIVDLCAADPYFVIETPEALKTAIDTIIPKH